MSGKIAATFTMSEKKHRDIDELLKGVLKANSKSTYYQLPELFEQRLAYLNITKHRALKILGIDHKTLASFLSGDAKKVDFVTILKFADFLEISHHEILDKHFQFLNITPNEELASAKKKEFHCQQLQPSFIKKNWVHR